jgi:hypothetical protein
MPQSCRAEALGPWLSSAPHLPDGQRRPALLARPIDHCYSVRTTDGCGRAPSAVIAAHIEATHAPKRIIRALSVCFHRLSALRLCDKGEPS